MRVSFTWQAQHLVTLEGDACRSADFNDVSYVTKMNHASHFAWEAQYLERLEGLFSWQAIAGKRKVVIFNTKCVSEARKVTTANGRVRDD